MDNIKTKMIYNIIYKLYHGQIPNVLDYPQELLKELHRARIIDGWPNERDECTIVGKGEAKIFDNAIKKYLNTK